MKKVIVTGGAGYIGSHTVVELIAAGYEPILIDNFSNSEERIIKQIEEITQQEIEIHNIDCKNEQQLAKLFLLEGKIDGVIHFAAHKAVGESVKDPLKYYRNNLISIMNLLKLMQEHNVSNFVFSSSCTVYGQPEDSMVKESTHRLDASSPYGNTKKICEDILFDIVESGGALKGAILRYFNPIGAHSSGLIGEHNNGVPNNLVPYITQTAAGMREKLMVFGDDYDTSDGSCIRDYIHVVDLAKAHVKALNWLEDQEDKNALIDVFNLGTGEGTSVLELVQKFQEVNQLKINWEIAPRRSGDIREIYANCDKAREVLGWTAEHSIEDALRDAWNWQQFVQENW